MSEAYGFLNSPTTKNGLKSKPIHIGRDYDISQIITMIDKNKLSKKISIKMNEELK